MLNVILCRGLVTADDNGMNTSYYLWNNEWYRMMSPYNMNGSFHAQVFYIDAVGYVGYHWNENIGGVQVLFNYIMLEVSMKFKKSIL